MLKLSKMTDYGTVIMTAMICEPQRSRSATEIAAATHVPAPTVSKILKLLAHGGLVVSSRGARGGYMLVRPPAQISMADIIEAMDGKGARSGRGERETCTVTPGLCGADPVCVVRSNWQRINRAVLGALRNITLDQMGVPAEADADTGPGGFTAVARKRG